MVKQLRYGMVGGDLKAFIGEVHRKAINFDTRAKLVAGCFSADEKLGVETAEAYNVDPSRTYKDYKEMAEKESQREDKIDFVSICTPNFLHYQIAKEFLLHDINVVCEKPLCFTQEEAVELEKIAKERNLVFAITYTYTGYTMVKVAKEMIEKEKDANPDPKRITKFQKGPALRSDPGKLEIQLGEKSLYIDIRVKSHNGKGCSEKGKNTDKPRLYIRFPLPPFCKFLIGDDNICLSYMGHIQIFLLPGNSSYQIHRRNYISSLGMIRYSHDPANQISIHYFLVIAGQLCHISQTDLRAVDLHVFFCLYI